MAENDRRMALEEALIDYVPPDRQVLASAFFSGLSLDELLFLAEFLGSCLLITSAAKMHAWDAVCHQAHAFRGVECRSDRQREDSDHKMVVLWEFAECCGFGIRLR